MKLLTFLFLALIFSVSLNAQKISIKDLSLEANVNTWYSAKFDTFNIKPLVGPLANVSAPGTSTNAYFMQNSLNWNESTLMYDGQTYSGMKIKYDIAKQQAYALHPRFFEPIILNQSLVEWFKTPIGTFKPRPTEDGYFLLLYEGSEISFIKESLKRLIIDNRDFEYSREDHFYVTSGSKKHRIRTAKSFLKLYPNYKKEIKRFMRSKTSRSIKRESKDAFLTHIAEYCDNLLSK